MAKPQKCPLCQTVTPAVFQDHFFFCPQCGGIFRSRESVPKPKEERRRYLLHQNSPQDRGYIDHLSPILKGVTQRLNPGLRGLDFGSGPSPILADLLIKRGFDVACYDPYFAADPSRLDERYDFIVCCEVIEHFHQPAREFTLLKSLLKPRAQLFCMTELFHLGMDFASWHYKNDFTHCFFYRASTLSWIKEHFGFRSLSVFERLIVFEN